MKKQIVLILVLCCVMLPCLGTRVSVPTRAMLYSALIPGGGQVYNQAWVKAGVVVGVQGYLIGSAIHHERQRAHYHDLVASGNNPIWNAAREKDYQKRLNNDIWWIGITMGLSMIDAFVDAHLADFDAKEKELKLRFSGTALGLEMRF